MFRFLPDAIVPATRDAGAKRGAPDACAAALVPETVRDCRACDGHVGCATTAEPDRRIVAQNLQTTASAGCSHAGTGAGRQQRFF
jgi:hypothetical protein